MSEFGEFIGFKVNATNPQGEPVELYCSPKETALYLHSAEFRDLDHIYHRYEDETENYTFGIMLWRHLIGDEAFDNFAHAMVESGIWEYHFHPEPLENDMVSYASLQVDIPDYLPEDFS